MQTIINQSLSDMLDKLLEKALEDTAIYASNTLVKFIFLGILKIEDGYMITISNIKDYNTGEGQMINYYRPLTSDQKEKIEQIFKKWGNNGK